MMLQVTGEEEEEEEEGPKPEGPQSGSRSPPCRSAQACFPSRRDREKRVRKGVDREIRRTAQKRGRANSRQERRTSLTLRQLAILRIAEFARDTLFTPGSSVGFIAIVSAQANSILIPECFLDHLIFFLAVNQ